MDGSIRITAEQRKSLLKIVRSKSGCEVWRALIVLHTASGKSYRWISETLFAEFDTIASVRESWSEGKTAEAVGGETAEQMFRGEQAEVATPGNNEKRHLAGLLVWRTGTLVVSPPGTKRNAELFLAHLDELRHRFRAARIIQVICDNAKFHDCRAVWKYLDRWSHRIQLHFLPKYAPETNPIERIWWRLHETVTRNHRAPTMDALLKNVRDWLDDQGSFYFTAQHPFAVAAQTRSNRVEELFSNLATRGTTRVN